ncbi:hypothetical protein MKX01_040425 [Papaver californicum]|nr:hypothetical protein MKX01_040425 [Papaver californicum]
MEEEKEQKIVENTEKLKEKKVKKVKDISEILVSEKAMTLKEMLGDIEKKKKIKTVESTGKDKAKTGETLKERTLTLKEMVEKLGKAKGKDKVEEPEKAKDEDKVEKKNKGKKKGKEKKKKEQGKEREERGVVAISERSSDLEAMLAEDSDFYSFDKDEGKVEKKSKGKKKGKEKKKKKEKGKEREERVVVAISERSSDLEAMLAEDSDFYSFDKDDDKVEKKNKGKKKGKEKKKKKKKEKGKEREETVVAISERSSDLEAMLVEDSDFYSFDKDRSERCFKKCQIWAAYGDSDGMPRHYGLVDEIISLNPFKVKVSWLALQGKGDNVTLILEGSDCQISCGKFKVDGKTVVNSVNIFSHIVDCERVAREIYMIYPKKGSVWALYGGSDRHDINQVNVVNGCYDIVVILTNYSEMTHGLSVAYLDKVKWFKTIFERREIGCHAVRWLEKDNVRLLSHQIPSRKLLGTEAPGLPKDCWELDPAALPQDLLVVEKDYVQQLVLS